MNLQILAAAALAALQAAPDQTVEIKTGPNGQISGSATAGDVTSSVRAGDEDEHFSEPAGRSEAWSSCVPGQTGRSVRVVSPDGTSASSVSVSSSANGVVSAGGAGSPGSRIYAQRCGPAAQAVPPRTGPRKVATRSRRHRSR